MKPLCNSLAHFSRRTLLGGLGRGCAAGLAAGWLTPVAESLGREEEITAKQRLGKRPLSVIMLWMQGGPSQLETFDPHPGSKIGGEMKAIKTAAEGVRIAAGLPQLAEQMDKVAVVRAVTSKEGDHERATYTVKNGYRPDPTLVHPSLGAILCHQTTDKVEIPRHISIQPGAWPARGGYLGDAFDAFRVNNPAGPIADVRARVSEPRFEKRLRVLKDVVEPAFQRRRMSNLDEKTLHLTTIDRAVRMMSSEQLKAFDLADAPESLRRRYGENRFGQGCLAAVRLVEVGVRCVEVTLNGWDSHANNHQTQSARLETLDPAFSTLLADLEERGLLESTLVVWAGEFGRTPKLNPAGGRDHWPHGFNVALAGCGIRGGVAVGETNPDPKLEKDNYAADLAGSHGIEDVHATMLDALGLLYEKGRSSPPRVVELDTPIGRPMFLSEGKPISAIRAQRHG